MVAVAMSGGVDSSVVAARVAATGLRAFGVTLALWAGDRQAVRDRGCCSIDAVDDARRVAATLGLPHYVWNLEREFEDRVVREFEDGYASGTTPNPCVRCNERVKFGLLLDHAAAAGATHVATGHYARTGRRGELATLHRARDPRRDQAYVLHRIGQPRLRRAVFPLGGEPSKSAVREEAASLGLITASKPESQDLCFVDRDMGDELRRRLAGRFVPGRMIDTTGAVIGEHAGLPFFTVGQRSGLGLPPDRPDAAPRYVIELRPAENAVVVGHRRELERTVVDAAECAWVSGSPPEPGRLIEAALRSHGDATPGVVEPAGPGGVRVRFASPVMQVSPGQALVLFDGDEVLGGGVIGRAT